MSKLESITLKNKQGLQITVLNYGGIIQSVKTADDIELVLGFENPEDYVNNNTAYLGAIIGRLANRVANARFSLDGSNYQLEANEAPHTLHAGSAGLDKVFWQMTVASESNAVSLFHHSPNGAGGFPGNLDISVTYTLTDHNALIIDYHATTDTATPLDLTNHTYWNLASEASILSHHAQFAADTYLETDNMIPTGKILPVQNTPLDFTQTKAFSTDIDDLKHTRGYDHYFVLEKSNELKLAATVTDPKSKRGMTVETTAPGFQCYTGNFLTAPHSPYQGFCIETQSYPNAVNTPRFPSVIINANQEYHHQTVFSFTL